MVAAWFECVHPFFGGHELEARSSLGKWEALDLYEVDPMGGILRSLEKYPLRGWWDPASCDFILDVISPSNVCSSRYDIFDHKSLSRV